MCVLLNGKSFFHNFPTHVFSVKLLSMKKETTKLRLIDNVLVGISFDRLLFVNLVVFKELEAAHGGARMSVGVTHIMWI